MKLIIEYIEATVKVGFIARIEKQTSGHNLCSGYIMLYFWWKIYILWEKSFCRISPCNNLPILPLTHLWCIKTTQYTFYGLVGLQWNLDVKLIFGDRPKSTLYQTSGSAYLTKLKNSRFATVTSQQSLRDCDSTYLTKWGNSFATVALHI